MYPREKHYFECACMSPEHVIAFTLDEYDENDCELYLEVQLINYMPWYKRVWPAIKYLLNIEPNCGRWDTWLLNPNDANKLKDLLVKYAKKKEDEAERQASAIL